MGWSYSREWTTLRAVLEAIERDVGKDRILARGLVREKGQRCAWYAITTPDGPLAVIALVEKDGKDYGFKLMSEDMHPYFYTVPSQVWDAVKDAAPHGAYSERWREIVKAKFAR